MQKIQVDEEQNTLATGPESAEAVAQSGQYPTQENADRLRTQARTIERRAYHLSDVEAARALDHQARNLRKKAQAIEERLPA